MKNAVFAAALCLAAAPALAGGYAEPVMEPSVIVEAASGNHTWIGVLMLLLVVAAATSN